MKQQSRHPAARLIDFLKRLDLSRRGRYDEELWGLEWESDLEQGHVHVKVFAYERLSREQVLETVLAMASMRVPALKVEAFQHRTEFHFRIKLDVQLREEEDEHGRTRLVDPRAGLVRRFPRLRLA